MSCNQLIRQMRSNRNLHHNRKLLKIMEACFPYTIPLFHSSTILDISANNNIQNHQTTNDIWHQDSNPVDIPPCSNMLEENIAIPTLIYSQINDVPLLGMTTCSAFQRIVLWYFYHPPCVYITGSKIPLLLGRP